LLDRIATPLHGLYVLKEIERAVLPPRDVLDQAHDKRFFRRSLDHQGGDFRLTEELERFDAPLAAHKIKSFSITAPLSDHSDRPLEPKLGNTPHDPFEDLAVSLAGIDHRDPVDRHKLYLRDGLALLHKTSVR
jgi:hypothetical protein